MMTWTPDAVSTAVIAPLLHIIGGSMEIKTINNSDKIRLDRCFIFKLLHLSGGRIGLCHGIYAGLVMQRKIRNWFLVFLFLDNHQQGIFYHLDDNIFAPTLYKLTLSAYRAMSSFIIGIEEECQSNVEQGHECRKRLQPLLDTVQSKLQYGIFRTICFIINAELNHASFQPSISETMTNGIAEALQEWKLIKSKSSHSKIEQ